MATKPDDPNLPRPETTNKEPEPAPRPDEPAVAGESKPTSGSDSAINLDAPGDEQLSGISLIEHPWLVDPAPSTGDAADVLVDSPSDVHLHQHLEAPPAAPPTEQPAPAGAAPADARLPEIDEDVMADFLAASGVNLAEEPVLSEAPTPAPPEQPGDSAIDLGAAVVEEFVLPAAKDSDSAIDLGGEAVIVGENLPVPAGRPSDSAIDLSADAVIEETVLPASPSDSAINVGIDAIIEETLPARPSSDESAIGLSSEAVIELPHDVIVEEGIDLPASDVQDVVELPMDALTDEGIELPGTVHDEVVDLTGEDVITASELDESGIDLTALPGVQGGSNPSLAPGESGIDLIAEDVILEEPVMAPPSSGGSARDLIAEGLESGVDLLGTKKREAAENEDALEHFLTQVGNEDQSSSVDLGSAHSIKVFDEEESAAQPARADSGVEARDLVAAAGEVEEGGIDLDVMGQVESKSAARKADEEATAAGDEVLAEADVEEDALLAGALEEAEAEGEVEEKPGKKAKDEEPVKQRGRAGAWMGGTVLGLLLGAGACVGAWVGLEPSPSSLREMVGLSGPKKTDATVGTGGPGTAAGFSRAAEHIKRGDLDKVSEPDLASASNEDAAQLVDRAEFRWLSYLKSERGKNPRAPLSPDADPVKKALDDLNKAVEKNNPDALFLRGQIREMTGNVKAAIEDYQKGATQFDKDPVQGPRFKEALERAREEPARAALQLPARERARLLVALLVTLQPQVPQPDTQPAPAVPEEAGYSFWKAVRDVRGGKYEDATKKLEDARARHDQRRFLFPKKQQNPYSDPREDIFLRSCDELAAYWTLLARLGSNPKYADAAKALAQAGEKDRAAAAGKLLATVEATVKSSAEAALVKDLGEKLLKDKAVAKPEDVVKLIGEERKEKDDKITSLDEKVKTQDKDIDGLKATVKKIEKDVTNLKTVEADQKKQIAGLQQAGKDADAALSSVADAVNVKFTDLKTSKDAVVKEVRETVRIANMKDPKGTVRRLETELVIDRAKLKERWEPAQMLPVWLAILESDRTRTDLDESALKDVRRVLDDPSSAGADRGRALAIEGLVQRNEEKFAAAEATLKKARAALADTTGPWLERVDAALSDVSAPGTMIAKQASGLAGRGKSKEALAALSRGLKVVDKKGALYAQRAAIGLDGLLAKGRLDGTDPAVADARQDAKAAADEGLAEGHYLLGRIDEELGQMKAAIASYRAAVKAHGELDAEGSRYRVALARALLKSRAGEVVPPRPVPPAERTGKAPPSPAGKPRRVSSLEAFRLVMALTTLQALDLPAAGPNVREAERLADEILKAGDKVPFDVRAQALAVKGLYTRALNTYTVGLREQGLLSPRYANVLLDLLANHPALRRPEGLTVPDPAAGERHYAAGLNFFASRRYSDAEKEFLSAVEIDNGDARYFYYLGLSRLAQNKRDAYEDFDQGARLEQLGRPDRAAVSAALERVQGPMRRVLNNVRNRPVKERAK